MSTPERLYYSDPFLSSFQGEIADIRQAARLDGTPAWQATLSRSAFYPTSGGQPYDTGVLLALSDPGAEVPVESVEEDEAGNVWHFLSRPLPVGTAVDGRIDWRRRFDHMQQHTGQHLLSAVFVEQLNLPTVSFHLGDEISTIDLAGGPISDSDMERVERICNEIIAEDRGVSFRNVSRSEAEALLASGRLRKLPEREGAIRLIEIEGCDLNACGGTHVRSTGQIAGLLLRGAEKVSRGVRVEFACGLRAVRIARADFAVLGQAAALLSSKAADVPATVARLLADAKSSTRERQKLREELAVEQARTLATEALADGGPGSLVRTFKDRDHDFVKLLASRTAAAAPGIAVYFVAEDTSPVRVFIARSKDLPLDCGRILRESLAMLGLRGGGSPDLAQGDVPREQEPKLREIVLEALRQAAQNSK